MVAEALRSAGYRAERDIKTFALTAAAGGTVAGGGVVLGGGAAIPQTIGLVGNIGARLLPIGMTQAQFGQELLKWGRGNAEAIARIGKVTLQELQAAGVTRQMAASWRDFYSFVSKIQPTNPSAAGRADLMKHVVDLFDKAP